MPNDLSCFFFLTGDTTYKPVVIQAVEGAHFLEGDVSRVQIAYDRGIRIFDVFHDEHANPSLGDVFGKPQVYGGLTDLGRETIREAERLGMVVDITHASEKTILDALQVVTKPFLLSHTALLSSLQSEGNPLSPFFEMRYISEELAKKITDAGGVIGVWPQITETPDVYAKRVRAMTNVVGTDHVALGSDSKITPAFDERKKSFNPAPAYKNHVWTAVGDSYYHSIVVALAKEGFSKEEIYKLCGGNFYKVFEAAGK